MLNGDETSKAEFVFAVARNFCSGVALILIICCYWLTKGERPRHSKSNGKKSKGEMSEEENVRG